MKEYLMPIRIANAVTNAVFEFTYNELEREAGFRGIPWRRRCGTSTREEIDFRASIASKVRAITKDRLTLTWFAENYQVLLDSHGYGAKADTELKKAFKLHGLEPSIKNKERFTKFKIK